MGTVMTKKPSFGKIRAVTKLKDQSFVSTAALKELENSLSVGSKQRLDEYRMNLSITRGDNSPNYDYDVEQVIKKYAIDPARVNRLISYLKGLTDQDGFQFSRNLKIYSTIESAMKRFSLPDHTSFRWNENYQSALNDLKLEYSKLRLVPLSYNSDEDIIRSVPKMDTHSGYTWIQSGYKKKGDNMDGIFHEYSTQECEAIANGSFSKPILIGFRTQGSGEFKDEDGSETNTCKHKLRVVSMIDLIQIIAELRFAKPIQSYMSRVDYYAGGKDLDQIGRIVSGYRAVYRNFVTLDYSSYDQTISSWLIRDAFEVLRCAFTMDDRTATLYDVIVHDFIHKEFVINEGIVKSNKGVPSGSMFTQIIDSIVNRLMISTYFKSINQKVDMIIMGDDNTLFTNADVDVQLIASYIRKNFGIEVNADKSKCGNTLKDRVEFLSCYWLDHGRWRAPEILLSKLLYSERFRKYGKYDNDSGSRSSNEGLISIHPKPEHVVWAYILTYPLGMNQLIKVKEFCQEHPIKGNLWLEDIGDEYLTGGIKYIRNYTMDNSRKQKAEQARRVKAYHDKLKLKSGQFNFDIKPIHHSSNWDSVNFEVHHHSQPHDGTSALSDKQKTRARELVH